MFDEWIYGLPDRAAYIQHYIEIFGQRSLDRFKARSYYSAPANYGVAFSSGWDNPWFGPEFGGGHERIGTIDEEKGELVDVD
jgi:glutaconate CoA-transferase subunit A